MEASFELSVDGRPTTGEPVPNVASRANNESTQAMLLAINSG
jgi:hypothetical protein